MTETQEPAQFAKELEALGTVLNALGSLDEIQRRFVLRTATERFGLGGSSALTTPQQLAAQANGWKDPRTPNGVVSPGQLDGLSPKDFLRLKKPTSELQRMVCLAYYLANARELPHFKTTDLTALNTEAAAQRFSNASATVNNATVQSQFFSPAGDGAKQLTALGEDYVRALPDQDAAKTAISEHKPKRKKAQPAKKKASASLGKAAK